MRTLVARLVAPRIPVPLAVSASFVALACTVLHVLQIGTLSHGAAHAGLATVALTSFPLVTS
jgi:hypothetical protein